VNARIHAHQVTCPLCHAHAGEACVSRQKNPLRFAHDERADLAARKTAEQERTVKPMSTCDACEKPIWEGEAVCFENTPDGGWLAHRDCCEDVHA